MRSQAATRGRVHGGWLVVAGASGLPGPSRARNPGEHGRRPARSLRACAAWNIRRPEGRPQLGDVIRLARGEACWESGRQGSRPWQQTGQTVGDNPDPWIGRRREVQRRDRRRPRKSCVRAAGQVGVRRLVEVSGCRGNGRWPTQHGGRSSGRGWGGGPARRGGRQTGGVGVPQRGERDMHPGRCFHITRLCPCRGTDFDDCNGRSWTQPCRGGRRSRDLPAELLCRPQPAASFPRTPDHFHRHVA